MRTHGGSAAAATLEISDGEFGTGLRARLELVRARAEAPPLPRRDISPELVLVSPEPEVGSLAELLLEGLEARNAPLGALLAEAGLIDGAEIELALRQARENGMRLGEVLVERGLVPPAEVVRLLAAQRGLPYVDLRRIAVDPAAAKLLPVGLARSLLTLPVGFVRGLPVVAVADPTDDDAMHDARSILHSARFVASPEDAILGQLARVYFALR